MVLVNENPAPVTVVGLGNMGSALARALLRRGHPVTVWNRTAHRAQSLAAEGAAPASDLRAAVEASGVVVACVSTYDVFDQLFEPVSGALRGRVLVNLTTGTPGECRKTSGWTSSAGASYLSGAIMATPSLIGRPETLIFYAGTADAFEAARPLLAAFGGRAEYLGRDPGAAALYDLALLTMLYGAWYSYLHAHAVLRAAGVSAAQFLPYVDEWLNHVVVPSLTDAADADALDRLDFRTSESNLAVNQWAIDLIVRSSREAGMAPDWLVPVQRLASRKVEEGFGADSFTRVFEALIAAAPDGEKARG